MKTPECALLLFPPFYNDSEAFIIFKSDIWKPCRDVAFLAGTWHIENKKGKPETHGLPSSNYSNCFIQPFISKSDQRLFSELIYTSASLISIHISLNRSSPSSPREWNTSHLDRISSPGNTAGLERSSSSISSWAPVLGVE